MFTLEGGEHVLEKRWRFRYAADASTTAHIVVLHPRVVVLEVQQGWRLVGVDRARGTKLYDEKIGEPFSVTAGNGLVSLGSEKVARYDFVSGKRLWVTRSKTHGTDLEPRDGGTLPGPALLTDERVIVTDAGGARYRSFQRLTLVPQWTLDLSDPCPWRYAPSFDRLLCQDSSGVRTIALATGTLGPAIRVSNVRAVQQTAAALILYDPSAIFAVDAATGKERWRIPVPKTRRTHGPQTLVARGETVIAVVAEDEDERRFTVRALDAGNGKERWRLRIAAPEGFSDQRGVLVKPLERDRWLVSAWGLVLD